MKDRYKTETSEKIIWYMKETEISAHDQIKQYYELTRMFDKTLTFVKDMGLATECTHDVFKVSNNGIEYVLKMNKTEQSTHKLEHWQAFIKRESQILEQLDDIGHLTHLVKFYPKRNERFAILKEYVEGNSPNQDGRRISETHLQVQILDTVKEIHKRGFANLDIHDNNIIVSPERSEAYLIDIGLCWMQNELSVDSFEYLKTEDFESLEENIFC